MNYSLTKFDRICFGTLALRYWKTEQGLLHFVHEQDSEQHEVMSKKKFDEIAESPEFRFEPNYYSKNAVAMRGCNIESQLINLGSKTRQKIELQYAIATAMDRLITSGDLKITDASICCNQTNIKAAAIECANELSFNLNILSFYKIPSPRTLRSIFKKYREGGRTIAKFGDRRHQYSGRKSVANTEEKLLLQKCVRKYIDVDGATQSQVVEDTLRAFADENKKRANSNQNLLMVYSASTIKREIKKLDPFEVDCGRLGIDEARRKYAMAGNGLSTLAPLERVEIDEWKVDVFTLYKQLGLCEKLTTKERMQIPRGRRWVVAAIDVATRVILGLVVVDNPSAEATKRLLFQIFEDKTDLAHSFGAKSSWNHRGTPSTIAFDTGSGFLNGEVIEALTLLGINYEFGPVAVPELRSKIERLFGSFSASPMPRLVGRSYGNIMERRKSPNEDRVALTDEDLTSIFINWVVDYYHNRPHSGMLGQTPNNAWKKRSKQYGIPPSVGWAQMTVALGDKVERKLGKKGLELNKLDYSCEELRAIYRPDVSQIMKVRIHPENIGFVMVWVDDRWVRADCITKDAWGLRLIDWLEEYRVLTQKHHKEGEMLSSVRDAAIKRIVSNVDAAKKRARLTPFEISRERLEHLKQQTYHGPDFAESIEIKLTDDPEIPAGQIIEIPAPASEEIEVTHIDDVFIELGHNQWRLEQ